MKNLFVRFVREDEGQDMTEYALLVAFIALVVYVGVQTFGTALLGWWNSLSTLVSSMPVAA